MTESFYRLELCPTLEGLEYYTSYETTNRSNDNAGVDLYSIEDYTISSSYDERHNPPPKAVYLLNLGTMARLIKVTPNEEEDVHYWLLPRSSIYKSGIMMANSTGVIDKTYRGVLMAPVTNLNEYNYPNISKGSRLFQIVAPNMGHIKEIKIVSSLPETLRGAGGFGSSGK
jgi:deoxyuridine 5'-triphosphate nucleotidohydrolase